jgi:hypothetical protein
VSRAACIAAAALIGAALAGCAAVEPTVPPPPTDAEALAFWQQSMDGYWDAIAALNPNLAKPDIPFTAFIPDPEKRSLLVTACQLQLGLYYKPGQPPTGPGGVDLIYYTCERQNPQDPRTSGYYTEDQLNWLYDFLVHRVAPCVELHGFMVPGPPAREQYVIPGAWTLFSWSPYARVPGVPGDAVWDSVYEACPRLPAGPFDYLRGMLTSRRL